MPASPKELLEKAESISWYHTMELGNGIITKGDDNTSDKLSRIALPEDLTGKSVLDIGAWDGAYSFEAERRGAERVVALDHRVWNLGGTGPDGEQHMHIPDPEQKGKQGFYLARKILGSQVEDVDLDVMDITPENPGIFDIVLFLGILYHVRHPLLAIEKVSAVTKELLILESYVALHGGNRPLLLFRPLTPDLRDNPPNVWAPNPAVIEHLLRGFGFRKIEVISRTSNDPDPKVWECRPERLKRIRKLARGLYYRARYKTPLEDYLGQIPEGRIVIHAWK